MKKNWQLDRRTFLKGAGVAMALPALEAMTPSLKAAGAKAAPQRLVCVGNPYGMIPQRFFPKQAGLDYDLPILLKPLASHRRDFTVFSNFDHGYSGGHRVVDTFLTGVKTIDLKSMPDGNISIDQRASEHVGARTRFSTLTLGVAGSCEMSWTRSGVNVPAITSSREVFQMLFVDDTAEAKKRIGHSNQLQGSILDVVSEHAKALDRRLGKRDREKLDEYYTSVRGVEKKLQMAEHWRHEPKPAVKLREPEGGGFVESLEDYYELMALALQTDSTRVISLEMPEGFNTSQMDLRNSYHGYSHHGKSPQLLEGLTVIETFQMEKLSGFLSRLKELRDADGSRLFDTTQVLFGSGIGNGSSHSNKNLPVLLAGGGYQHRGHVVLPEAKRERVPLCNLYVTLLRRFGLEIDVFNSSGGVFDGLG
ncbi:MAG: hypothetical protein ACI9VS_003906 [Candidatus Binatia bacterium]|jgi:hypothetical protein